jgi:hypothetical protein
MYVDLGCGRNRLKRWKRYVERGVVPINQEIKAVVYDKWEDWSSGKVKGKVVCPFRVINTRWAIKKRANLYLTLTSKRLNQFQQNFKLTNWYELGIKYYKTWPPHLNIILALPCIKWRFLKIVTSAVKQWRPRLRLSACVWAGGGHFEFKLWITPLNNYFFSLLSLDLFHFAFVKSQDSHWLHFIC